MAATVAHLCVMNLKDHEPSSDDLGWRNSPPTHMEDQENPLFLDDPLSPPPSRYQGPTSFGLSRSLSGTVPTKNQVKPCTIPVFAPETCQTHPTCSLEYYCEEHQLILGIKCLFIHHNGHNIKRLGEVAHSRLYQNGDRYVRQHLQQKKSSTEFFRSTVDTLKELVVKRQDGDTKKEDTPSILQKLEDAYTERVCEQETYCKYVNEKIESFQHLQAEFKKAVERGTMEAFLSGREHITDCDLKEWLKQQHASLQLHSSDIFLFLEDAPQDANPPHIHVSHIEAKIEKIFTCTSKRDSQDLVQSICISSLQYILVAYQEQDSASDAVHDGWIAKFTPKGKSHWKPQATKGRVSLTALQDGVVRVEGEDFPAMNFATEFLDVPDNSDESKLYDVHCKLNARFLLRVRSHLGDCQIRSVTVDGLGTTDKTLFSINSTNPVAMDASKDGTLFAVLERGQEQVKLYSYQDLPQNGSQEIKPRAIYTGNGQPFVPRDVCFFPIGGKERLVVADWLNDVLHVLDVTEGCDMIGQVGGDCLDLLQPTALCPDLEGHLWIGCQGGSVLSLSYFND